MREVEGRMKTILEIGREAGTAMRNDNKERRKENEVYNEKVKRPINWKKIMYKQTKK